MYAIVNIEFVGSVIVVPYGFLMGMAIVPSRVTDVLPRAKPEEVHH